MKEFFTRYKPAILGLCVAITFLTFYITKDNTESPGTIELKDASRTADSNDSFQITDTDTGSAKSPMATEENTDTPLLAKSNKQQTNSDTSLKEESQEMAQAEPVNQVQRNSNVKASPPPRKEEEFDRKAYLTEERKALLNGPRNAAKEGRWEDFIAAVEDIIQQTNYDIKMSHSIGKAIQYNAPFWVYEKLIEQGQRFEYVHTLQLASNNKHQLIKDLQRLGLDIHAVAPDGENAVYASLTFFYAKETFDYLILNGVNAQSSVNGIDTLEFALKGAIKKSRACHYVVTLINTANVSVLPKHSAILKQVEQQNNPTYQCITASVGEV